MHGTSEGINPLDILYNIYEKFVKPKIEVNIILVYLFKLKTNKTKTNYERD